MKAATIFNLQGVRMQQQRGINIINHKKVFVK